MASHAKLSVLFLTIILLASYLILCSNTGKAVASSRTIVVPDDFFSIQAAVDNANAGDTVFVKSGTYDFSNHWRILNLGKIIVYIGLTIDKPILLLGQNCTIIWAPTVDPEPSNLAISVESDNVLISGFTIISQYRAINLSGENITLTNNTVKTNSTFSTVVGVVGNATISSNVIEGGYRGIGIFNGEASISNNLIYYCDTGIEIGSASGNQNIFENTITNNSIGVSCSNAPLLLYHNSIVNCSKYGVYLGKHGVYDATTVNVNATFNYWGTNESSVIESMIYDSKNERSLGNVTFTPFLTRTPQVMPSQSVDTSQNSTSLNPGVPIWVAGVLIIIAIVIVVAVFLKRKRR